VKSVLQPGSKRHGAFDVCRFGQYDDKLVAAEAGGDRGSTRGLAQQVGKALDEPVAGVLAEVLVDDLEAVQVEEQYRYWSALAFGQSFVEVGDQRSAVQQTGQVIVFGEVPDLLLGDSAGLVDPITGEGLYYALRSAELCAGALLAGQPDEYRRLLTEDVLAELKLAARVSQRFYSGQIFGDSVLERMVSLTAQSASFRDLMSDLFAGIQGYRDLRARLYRILPAVMAEGLAGTLRRPRNNSAGGSECAANSFAE